MKKNNIYVVLVLFIICLGLTVFSFLTKSNDYNKINNVSSKKQIDYTKLEESIKNIREKNMFQNREIICEKKEENIELLVGKNVKELENNFFDIKITVSNNKNSSISALLEINKLWKELTNSQKLYEQPYVEELVLAIKDITNKDINKSEQNALSSYIISQYLAVKDMEKNKGKLVDYITDNMSISNITDSEVLKLMISI